MQESIDKKNRNLAYREYDVSGLSMLENGVDDLKYVKSFNLQQTDGEDHAMETVVPGGQNEFAEQTLGNPDDMLTPDDDQDDGSSGNTRQKKVKIATKKDLLKGDLSFIKNFNDFGMKKKLDRRGRPIKKPSGKEEDFYQPISYKGLVRSISDNHPCDPDSLEQFPLDERITVKYYLAQLSDLCLCYELFLLYKRAKRELKKWLRPPDRYF